MEQTNTNGIKFTAVSNPVFANAEKTAINCEVKFTHFDQVLPFSAVIDDDEEHGRRIYQYCIDGKAGKVKAFKAAKIDHSGIATASKEALSAEAEKRINILHRAIRLEMATEAEKKSLEEWERYSILLERVEVAEAPDIDWPQVPQ